MSAYLEQMLSNARGDLQSALNYIAKLVAEIDRLKAERQWIPANLSPAKDGEYWVYVENITWGSYRERRTFSVSYGWLDVHPPEHVTHWMPLPPPPEGEA